MAISLHATTHWSTRRLHGAPLNGVAVFYPQLIHACRQGGCETRSFSHDLHQRSTSRFSLFIFQFHNFTPQLFGINVARLAGSNSKGRLFLFTQKSNKRGWVRITFGLTLSLRPSFHPLFFFFLLSCLLLSVYPPLFTAAFSGNTSAFSECLGNAASFPLACLHPCVRACCLTNACTLSSNY